jgi:replicative DNA helicase
MGETAFIMPSAVEAEKGAICALLNNPEWALSVFAKYGVTRQSFYIERHAIFCDVAIALHEAKRPLDLVTVTQRLTDLKKLEECGGRQAVHELFAFNPTLHGTEAYLEDISEKQVRRESYVACMKAANEARNGTEPIAKVLSSHAADIANLSMGRKVDEPETILKPVQDKLNRMTSNEPKKDIVLTGIDGLDRHSPLKLGDMPTISGEKKAGKSILALTILAHVGLELKLPTLYFSLEDRTEQVIDRLYASVSRVPIWKHHKSAVNSMEMGNLSTAGMRLGGSKIYVRDDIFDLSAIVAFTKRLKAKEPTLGVVVVDYAQLVRGRESKSDNREQEVARISRTLRLLALELRVAIILICQLNSDGETRESRAIEMDTTAMWKVCNGREQGTKLIAVPFQRNGTSNIAFPITFLGQIARFENQAKTEVEDYEAPTKKGKKP